MNAFQYIIQKYNGQDKIFIMNKKNYYDFFNYIRVNKYNEKTKTSFFLYYYFMQLVEESESNDYVHKKFTALSKFLTNIFINEESHEEMLCAFSKIQKTYYGFSRLAHIYKFKKAKVQVNTDLCMNELNPNKTKNVFVLLQNNCKYYFTIRDLINMINRNLSNCISFVPDPIILKNPYNNLKLTQSNLYNIYFFIRWSGYVIPELFHGYFICNFNIYNFSHNYEFNIVNLYIKNFIYNSHHDVLYPIFEDMWDHYKSITKKIVFDCSFPRDKLINIMKPYLHLYYTSLYATNGSIKQCNAEYILRKKLMRFRNFNPRFGRKYIRYKKDIYGKRTRIEEYELKHINFYNSSYKENNVRQETTSVEPIHDGGVEEGNIREILRVLTETMQNSRFGNLERQRERSLSYVAYNLPLLTLDLQNNYIQEDNDNVNYDANGQYYNQYDENGYELGYEIGDDRVIINEEQYVENINNLSLLNIDNNEMSDEEEEGSLS
jgi:hypothetical protein